MKNEKVKLVVLEDDAAVNVDMALDMLDTIIKNNVDGKQTVLLFP